jgi:hypothetical protein
MYAIILGDQIEAIVGSTTGIELTGRTTHVLSSEEEALVQGGFAVQWNGSGLVKNLDAVKRTKLAAISTEFESQVATGCNSDLGRVDCDDKAQVRIANIIALRERAVAASIPVDPTVRWTMWNGSQVDHDDAELQALGFAIGFGFAAKFQNKQALEQLVSDASDAGEIDAIDVTEGWPS